jgi:hypothetical protein
MVGGKVVKGPEYYAMGSSVQKQCTVAKGCSEIKNWKGVFEACQNAITEC